MYTRKSSIMLDVQRKKDHWRSWQNTSFIYLASQTIRSFLFFQIELRISENCWLLFKL